MILNIIINNPPGRSTEAEIIAELYATPWINIGTSAVQPFKQKKRIHINSVPTVKYLFLRMEIKRKLMPWDRRQTSRDDKGI